MSIRERLGQDLKRAMKEGDKPRLSCVRMLVARLKEREIDLRAKHGAAHALTDDEALEVFAGYAKQRRESIEAYRQAGRDDLVAAEQAELRIVQDYLPQQLGEDELRAIVRQAIAASGASSARDLGAVMKLVVPQTKGRADGKRVNEIVRELLAAG